MQDRIGLFFEDLECDTCPAYLFNFKLGEWNPDPVDVASIPVGSHIIHDGEEMVKKDNGELRHLKAGERELWDGESMPDAAAAGTLTSTRTLSDDLISAKKPHPLHGIGIGRTSARKKFK